MRGFLFTTLTILMFLSVYTIATAFYRTSRLQEDKSDIIPIKSRVIYDDLLSDVTYIENMTSHINRSTFWNVQVRYSDFLPAPWNITETIANYSLFLENVYERELNTNLTMNVSRITPKFPIIPYDYTYGYPDFEKTKIYVINDSTFADYIGGYKVNVYLASSTLDDLIWMEAEDFSSADKGVRTYIKTSAQTYNNSYVQNWTQHILEENVTAGLATNYTLWVRSRDDNRVEHNFTVQVNGINNSFEFGDHGTTGSMVWGWEQGDEFTLNGHTRVRLFTPATTTAQADVIVLKTSETPLTYTFGPPATLNDTLILQPALMPETTSTSISVELRVFAGNINFSYSENVNQSDHSNFTFIMENNDIVNLTFGKINNGLQDGEYSMLLEYYNSTPNNFAGIETTVLFETF